MAKKNGINILYLIGLVAVVVGFFLPVISIPLGPLGKIDFTLVKGFKNLDDIDSWFALLSFASAVFGVVLCFVSMKSNLPLKLIALVASFVLGMVFFARANFFESWFDIVGIGFYVILAGWIVALVGYFIKK